MEFDYNHYCIGMKWKLLRCHTGVYPHDIPGAREIIVFQLNVEY